MNLEQIKEARSNLLGAIASAKTMLEELDRKVGSEGNAGRSRVIQGVICDYYGLHPRELTGRNRSRKVAWPRQVAMQLTRQLCGYTTGQVGMIFGRDHSSVCHAETAVDNRRAKLGGYNEEYVEIFNLCQKAFYGGRK